MKNKVTLITPPDIFENNTKSVLFINTVEADQEKITNWLSNSTIEENLNIYFYAGENNVQWLLYALGKADICFVDLDNHCDTTIHLSGYILSMAQVYYKTIEQKTGSVFQHINSNRVPDMDYFLDNALLSLIQTDK